MIFFIQKDEKLFCFMATGFTVLGFIKKNLNNILDFMQKTQSKTLCSHFFI
jgi:hypothetical protein